MTQVAVDRDRQNTKKDERKLPHRASQATGSASHRQTTGFVVLRAFLFFRSINGPGCEPGSSMDTSIATAFQLREEAGEGWLDEPAWGAWGASFRAGLHFFPVALFFDSTDLSFL